MKMDDLTVNEKMIPLTKQVRECIDAKMSIDEGGKYVGIYHNGYGLIVRLINIANDHYDQSVRSKAQGFLDKIDNNGGIGTMYREAYAFSSKNRVKIKLPNRRTGDKGVRKLTASEKARIAEYANSNELSEDESSEVKRIQASIFEDKIASVDYNKLRQIIVKHQTSKPRSASGWSKVDEKIFDSIQSLLDRPDVSDVDKIRMFKIMDGVQDGKMPT